MKRFVLALLLASCAHGGQAEGPQDTEIQVVDQAGDPLIGSMSFWSRGPKDKCTVYGASCSVALPAGDYSFTFHKERAGRPGSSIGGQVQEAKRSGCLKARVHVVPGRKIVCKQVGDFNCFSGAYGNLDCGAADAAKSGGATAAPEDEPPPVGSPQEQ
jgi:hypothetical protein